MFSTYIYCTEASRLTIFEYEHFYIQNKSFKYCHILVKQMKIKRVKDYSYWDNRISIAVVFYFIASCANATTKTILGIPESMWGVLSMLWGVLIIYNFAFCFNEVYRRSKKILTSSFAIFIVIYSFSAVLCSIRGEGLHLMLRESAFLTFAWWIPVGVYACSVVDKEVLYRMFVKASYLISILALLMFFIRPIEINDGAAEYNMTFGNYIMLPILFHINEWLRKKRIWLLVFLLFEVATVIIYSNRGVLLSLFVFVIYKFAWDNDSRAKKAIAIVVLFVIVYVLFVNSQIIVSGMLSILDTLGLRSRTLEMIIAGSIEDSSGRDDIWRASFKMIEEKPILGWGLGGEYYELYNAEQGIKGDAANGSYTPHNGLIQNFVNFGIFGGLIANIIVSLPLLNLRKYKSVSTNNLIQIFFCAVAIPTLISASGFFIKPEVAVYLYLFYYGNKFRNTSYENKRVLIN